RHQVSRLGKCLGNVWRTHNQMPGTVDLRGDRPGIPCQFEESPKCILHAFIERYEGADHIEYSRFAAPEMELDHLRWRVRFHDQLGKCPPKLVFLGANGRCL